MRYQKIHSQIWNDEKFITLSPKQQRLFLYILTCPHGNIIGMFVLKMGYVCDDLKCTVKDLEKDLRKLIESEVIKYDFSTSIVLIKRFLRHNPITNPNQVKAAKNMFNELPKSKLLREFVEVLPEVLKEEFKEVLLKPEDSVSDSVSEEVKKPEKQKEENEKFLRYVFLSKEDHNQMVEKIGKILADEYIERLDGYIGQIGVEKARAKYKSHYDTMMNWYRKDLKEGKIQIKKGYIPPEPPVFHEHEKYDPEKVKQVHSIVEGLAKTMEVKQ